MMRMMTSNPSYSPRYCPSCGKGLPLTRNGTYRRHFTTSESGQIHKCPASGRNGLTPAERARPDAWLNTA